MNFKSIGIGLAAAASVLGVTPAQAAPTECAFLQGDDLLEFPCDLNVRTNANGHKVNDIVFFDGNQRFEWSIIVWSKNGVPEYSELFHAGRRVVANAYKAKNGFLCVANNDTTFCFN